MTRLSENDLLRLACLYAEQDREAFVQAHSHMLEDPAARKAVSFLKQLRAYRLRRWGQTAFEASLAKMVDVSAAELIRDHIDDE